MTGAAAPNIVEKPVVAQASLAATTAGGIDAAAEQAASPSAEELVIARELVRSARGCRRRSVSSG